MAYLPDDDLKKLAKQINKDGKPVKMSPKDLLNHFGTSRRKTHVKWWIDKGLKDLNIQTYPDYKTEYLYGEIQLKKAVDKQENEDFIQRLKLLDASNRQPVFVTKNDTLKRAITLMMTHDFSQLPVMNSANSRSVDGMISWHSIGWSNVTKDNVAQVSDCMKKDVTILSYDMPILEAVEIIKEKEVVLVQKEDKSIAGLVTITDIAEEFFGLVEPFLYIGQIETSLRVLLDDKFTKEELEEIKYGDDAREIFSVSDLTFNEYIQLLRKGDNWDKIKLPLDKDEFCKKLEEVRDIRNEVMHFSSDQLDTNQEKTLKQIAQFFKEVLK